MQKQTLLASAIQTVRELPARVHVMTFTAGASLGPVLAFATDPTTAEEAVTGAKTTILAMVALGGAAIVAVALAKVGWNVGAKLIGRLGGKA